MAGNRKWKVPVAGDLTKVKHVEEIKNDRVATRMLSSLRASFERIEGSQEIRFQLRRVIDAYRVYYGQPIMVTFSPDERLNILVARFHRVRKSDTCFKGKVASDLERWCQLDSPSLVRATMEELSDENLGSIGIPFSKFEDALPGLKDRKRIAARDPLACVYAFNMMCTMFLCAILGVRVCPNCPHCDCRDTFGSVSTTTGGGFGRADAYVGSKECQKAGNLHLHLLIFVQCLHQNSSMSQLLTAINQNDALLQQFFDYKDVVNCETYFDPTRFEESQDDIEQAWPFYEDGAHLLVQVNVRSIDRSVD